MIMKKNTGKYKKVPVTFKIDSQSSFQKCLPEGLNSCSSMESLGFNNYISYSILCLVVWHLQFLYLTMFLYPLNSVVEILLLNTELIYLWQCEGTFR